MKLSLYCKELTNTAIRRIMEFCSFKQLPYILLMLSLCMVGCASYGDLRYQEGRAAVSSESLKWERENRCMNKLSEQVNEINALRSENARLKFLRQVDTLPEDSKFRELAEKAVHETDCEILRSGQWPTWLTKPKGCK